MPRKKLPQGEGKRHPLHFRTTLPLRQRLDVSAAESGRSLAQEVEARLETSFALDQMATLISERMAGLTIDFMVDAFGGEKCLMAGLYFSSLLATRQAEAGTDIFSSNQRSGLEAFVAECMPRLLGQPMELPSERSVRAISGVTTYRATSIMPDELKSPIESSRRAKKS